MLGPTAEFESDLIRDRQLRHVSWMLVSIPNVLATRYASPELVELWSPEHKIALERQLWIAVLRAQSSLGVDVPNAAIADYEAVVDQVDLASIAERERVTRHDVKARIEEFNALAATSTSTRGSPAATSPRTSSSCRFCGHSNTSTRTAWPSRSGWPSALPSTPRW